MSILNEIGSLFTFDAAETQTAKVDNKTAGKDQKQSIVKADNSYNSKEASDAISNNARAEINISSHSRLRACTTSHLVGELFPDIDKKQITQDYLKLRQEAKKKAADTTRRLYRTFTTGDLSDLVDKNGNIIATFSIPEPPKGEYNVNDECCSYKMTEYNPKTKEVVAVTRVYNHDGFNKEWKKRYAPYIERIEFGKNPEDTTFLRASFSNKQKDGRYILHPNILTYAKGYKSDGVITGIRKADKYLSNSLHQGYESYRTNYEAPVRIFDGCLYSDPASVTENDGMYGEKFDSALEYPIKQFKFDDEIFVFNPYYINEEGNRKKEE